MTSKQATHRRTSNNNISCFDVKTGSDDYASSLCCWRWEVFHVHLSPWVNRSGDLRSVETACQGTTHTCSHRIQRCSEASTALKATHQDEMGPLFPGGQARSLGPTLGTALRFLINQPAARCVALDILVPWVLTYPSSPPGLVQSCLLSLGLLWGALEWSSCPQAPPAYL